MCTLLLPLTHVASISMKKYHSGDMAAVVGLLYKEYVNFDTILVFNFYTFMWQFKVAWLQNEQSGVRWIVWVIQQKILSTV